jgi:putative peptide zinc metalloprotease protein
MAATLEQRALAGPRPEALILADGVELIGEYAGSGFKKPPLLVRRADGQMIQLTRLLYLVAAACNGRRDAPAGAGQVSRDFGRRVSARNVRMLVEEQLRPLGVLALADGTTPELPKRGAVFALRYRKPIFGERPVNAIAGALTWLHRPAIVFVSLATIACLDVWLFGIHGIAPALRSTIYAPGLLLAVLASTVVAAAWHECGHASACRYGGARPGVVGVGLYLVWPAFYCDVTDAYRLDRPGRLRTDLGGVYFNALFALGAGGAYFATGQEPFLLVAFMQHMVILQQLLPLLRFDGYYVMSDLTGVPDILSRVKPIFRSLVPWRRNDPRVDELKPWVRIVVTAYLALLIPTLALMLFWTAVSAPRVLATVHDSLGLQLDRIRAAVDFPTAVLGVLRLASLVLPVAAISLSLGRSGRMAVRGLDNWSRGSSARRGAAAALLAAVVGGAAFIWWPNGDYEPIRPGERGTVGELVTSIPEFPSGRPSFPVEHGRRFGPQPTVREEHAGQGAGGVQRDRSSRPDARDGSPPPAAGAPSATPTGDTPVDPDPSRARTATPEPVMSDPDPGPSPDHGPSPAASSTPAPTAPVPAAPAPTATATATATPDATTTPDGTPTATPTATPSASVTADPTPEPSATPSPPSALSTATPESAAETDSTTPTPTPTP